MQYSWFPWTLSVLTLKLVKATREVGSLKVGSGTQTRIPVLKISSSAVQPTCRPPNKPPPIHTVHLCSKIFRIFTLGRPPLNPLLTQSPVDQMIRSRSGQSPVGRSVGRLAHRSSQSVSSCQSNNLRRHCGGRVIDFGWSLPRDSWS